MAYIIQRMNRVSKLVLAFFFPTELFSKHFISSWSTEQSLHSEKVETALSVTLLKNFILIKHFSSNQFANILVWLCQTRDRNSVNLILLQI